MKDKVGTALIVLFAIGIITFLEVYIK
jgi:hypothetical protein